MRKLIIALSIVLTLLISFIIAQNAGMSGGIIQVNPFINISNITLFYPNGTLINRNDLVLFTGEFLNFIVGIASPLGDKGMIDVFVAVNNTIQANCKRDGTFITNLTINISSNNITSFRAYVDNTSNGTYYQTFYNSSENFTQLNLTFNNGTFLSFVIDASSIAQWNNISWIEGLPYQEELPNNNSVETVFNGANMTGNVLLMHFNNDSIVGENDTIVLDFSGNKNNGTWLGGKSNGTSKFGKYSGNFDGIDDYLNVSDSNSLDITNEITIESWVYANSLTNYHTIISKQAGNTWVSPYAIFNLRVNNDDPTPNFECWTNSYFGRNVIGATTLLPNTWYHAACTYDGVNTRLYVNGVLDGSLATIGSLNTNNLDLAIGSHGTGANSGEFWNGYIDELAIYNRTLSESELLNHYKRGALNLNITIRSCDDINCINDPWNNTYTFPLNNNLDVINNQYFQFNATFFTENLNYSPELFNVTINYFTNQIIITNLALYNVTGTYFNCTLTAEPNMTGNMTIGLGILDFLNRSTIFNLTNFWFNPGLGNFSLALSNIPINFPYGIPGQTVYYNNVTFTNLAENNLCLRVLMSGRDMYAFNGTALCPTSNVLSIDNVRYSANSSIYNFTGGVSRTPSEIIPGLQICPGQSITINFSLTYPIPCIGQFNNSNALHFYVERVT